MDFRLENDSSMIVSGPSKSGKSTFVANMIKNRHTLFKKPIRKVWWYYGIESPFHKELQDVILKMGVPTQDDFDQLQENDLIVLDDLQQESQNNETVTGLFLRGSHHKRFFAVQITQYLYGDKEQRMRNGNVHYLVAFNNPRNQQQLAQFMGKMLPKGNMSVVHDILTTLVQKYGNYAYLFIDFTTNCPFEYRFRTNLFNPPMIVFKLSKRPNKTKMDFSELVVVPKSDMNEHTGGGQQMGGGDTTKLMSTMLQRQAEDQRVRNMMMNPQQAHLDRMARDIVRHHPTANNIAAWNARMYLFDKVRRQFFNLDDDSGKRLEKTTKPLLTHVAGPPALKRSKGKVVKPSVVTSPKTKRSPLKSSINTRLSKKGVLELGSYGSPFR